MAHTFTRLLAHVVFSTKNRRPFIDAELKPRLLPYLAGIASELGARSLAANAVSDHVHILLSLPATATAAVADVLRIVKTNSSRWVHEIWPARSDFGWQTGYGAFSVSESNTDPVRRYIADQEQHHRTMSFQEEFLALLRKHHVEYDERYIWE